MAPKQQASLRDLIMNCHSGIIPYVDSLLAAERAAVVAAMLEYLPVDSHEKITTDVLRKLGENNG